MTSVRSTTKLDAAFEDDAALAAGTVIAGRYRILETIGAGAMGTVYLAEHLAIGRRVAVKVLAAGWTRTADVTRRFRAEARAASSIGHPNIVEVLDADELPDGRPFIVMELLKGRDLFSVLRKDKQLPWQRVCHLCARISHALAAAHAIGIIHRDLKAENVMIVEGPSGEVVKVLDFGIAVNIAEGGERATRPGIAVGTPEYMAPEQARGEPPTAKFDIYAVGVLMFELLTGAAPFTAANPLEILGRKAVSPAPSVATRRAELPEELVRLVDACLAMDPGDRPASATALAEQLDALQQSSNEVARLVSTGAHAARRGVEPWAVALVSALVLGTAVVVAWPNDDPPAPISAAHVEQDAPTPVVEPTPPRVAVETKQEPPTPPPVEPTQPIIAAPPEPTPVGPVAKKKPRDKDRALPTVSGPEPTPTPAAPDDSRCEAIRREAEDARQAYDWRGVLSKTKQRECWPVGGERDKLRVKATMELGRFDECIEIGRGSSDPQVVKWVQLCQKRIDSKAEDGG